MTMDAYDPGHWYGEWLRQQGGPAGFAADPFSNLNNSVANWRQDSKRGGTDVTYYSGYTNAQGQWVPGSRPGFSGGGGAGAAQSGGSGGGAAGSGAGGGAANFGNVAAGTSTTAPAATAAGGSAMSWADWAQLAAGAYSSYQDSSAAKKASKNAGKVDLWSEESPWGPSVDYRTAGMERMLELLRGGGQGAPGGAAGGGGRGGGGGGRGAGGGPEWWETFRGSTENTDRLMQDMRARAEGGHTLYGPANEFTKGYLRGEDPNAYRRQTFDELSEFDDPDLRRFKDMLFSGQMPGTAGSDPLGTRNGRGGYGGGGRGGGGGGGTGPIGIEKYIKEFLDRKFVGDENPELQGMIDASTRDIQRKFMEEDVPGVTSMFAGAGRMGSGAWSDALAKAERERSTALGDTVGKLRFQDREARLAEVQNALGLGTEYDLGAMKIAADRAAAAGGASASMYATDRESQDRMSLARMSALQDAIGGGIDLNKFRLGGMSSLADMYSGDQMGALSMVPELSGLDLRDLGAAGELSIASDRNRGDYGLGLGDLREKRRATQSAASGRRGALDWEREQYFREEPWKRAMQYADVVDVLGGRGGTRHEWGTDQRNVSPYTGSPWGQAAAGGLAAWYASQDDRNRGT